MIEKSETTGEEFVYFAMNEQDWLSLGAVRTDTIRYIGELHGIVEYYRSLDQAKEKGD